MKTIALAAFTLGLAAPAAATDLTVLGQASDASFTYMKIEWTRSTGVKEPGVIRLACTGGKVGGAWLYAPRDMATGMATGKRMHKPFTIVKEWGAASPSLSKGSWDLATAKGARMAGGIMAMDDWQAIAVNGLDDACAAPPTGKVNVQDLSITK
ncbi:MAG: hypothetical protein ABIR77_07890 [Sphingomicrobium sp.]